MPPTYVPVIRTGVDVTFADVTVTGTLAVTGAATLADNLSVTGYTALAAGQADGQWTLWSGAKDVLRLGTAGGGIDWNAPAGWNSGYSPYASGKDANGKGGGGNFADFLVKAFKSGGATQDAQGGYDSLGKSLLGSKPGKGKAPR